MVIGVLKEEAFGAGIASLMMETIREPQYVFSWLTMLISIRLYIGANFHQSVNDLWKGYRCISSTSNFDQVWKLAVANVATTSIIWLWDAAQGMAIAHFCIFSMLRSSSASEPFVRRIFS